MSGCQIKAGAERGLLMALRKAEKQIASYLHEDTDLHRAMWKMKSEHSDQLLDAEQIGFERGLNEATKDD